MNLQLNTSKKIGLALLTGVLFWLAWSPNIFFPLAFVAFIPLLILQQYFHESDHPKSLLHFWGYSYLSLLVFNLLTTWWIWNAAGPGSIPAFTLNTLLMTIPWVLFFTTRKKLGEFYGYLSLIAFWLSFEYIHLQWELTWPWLTLGNVFAKFPQVYQWYEYTGHLGGSVWVLAINILLFQAIIKTKLGGFSIKHFTTSLAIIIVPILVSVVIYFQHKDKGTKVNVTVVQPNVDPYTQKFSAAFFEDQWQKLTELSLSKSNAETQFIVWPETSVPGTIWLNKLDQSPSLKRVNEMLQQVPKATLITGVDAYDMYDLPETPTARKFRDGECCFDAFNSAFQIDTGGVAAVYHKSKLVPGVERMPYPKLFSFLENFALDLGGTTGSLGTQAEREIFTTKNNLKVGAAICYESVFGEFVTEYIRKGAQAIFIVTNDAWWYNTPGHKQHVVYASLRAVETRKSIARSANTGISCFVNQRGDIQQATQYETTTAINQDIYFNDEETFYVRYGDLVARIALFMAGYFLLLPYIKLIRAKRNSLR